MKFFKSFRGRVTCRARVVSKPSMELELVWLVPTSLVWCRLLQHVFWDGPQCSCFHYSWAWGAQPSPQHFVLPIKPAETPIPCLCSDFIQSILGIHFYHQAWVRSHFCIPHIGTSFQFQDRSGQLPFLPLRRPQTFPMSQLTSSLLMNMLRVNQLHTKASFTLSPWRVAGLSFYNEGGALEWLLLYKEHSFPGPLSVYLSREGGLSF